MVGSCEAVVLCVKLVRLSTIGVKRLEVVGSCEAVMMCVELVWLSTIAV